jgi:hypothetical protein
MSNLLIGAIVAPCDRLESGLKSVSEGAERHQNRYHSTNECRDCISICVIHEAAANEINRGSGKEQTERSHCGAPLSEKPGKHAGSRCEAINPRINEPPLEAKIAIVLSSILERSCCRQIEVWNTI